MSTPASESTERSHEIKYTRFTIAHRIEHWVFISSFITLAITGLVQKFASSPISETIVGFLGGIENTRLIHHIAATLMMVVVIYHLGAAIFRLYVLRVRPTLVPTSFDFKAFWQEIIYILGRRQTGPQQGRYTFQEKFEYWAVVWGTIIMAVTGFVMWNPITTTQFLPGEIVPAAKAAHGAEAILAALSILIWHFYHVFVKHFNKSMYTGKMGEHEMMEEHAIELADIKAGTARLPLDPETYKRRLRIFIPSYGIVAALLSIFLIWFLFAEDTAIATIPPQDEQVEIFVPLTATPLPTPLPTATTAPIASLTWEGGIAQLFEAKCSACHNSGQKSGGLDLGTYESVLAGGNSAAGVIPGDAGNSQVVIIQSPGNHFGQFTGEELAQIIEWIEAGAHAK